MKRPDSWITLSAKATAIEHAAREAGYRITVTSIASSEYTSTNWLYTPAVALEPRINAGSLPPVCYQVTYAPLANGTDIRVIVTGFDFSFMREGFDDSGNLALVPVKRTVMQDVRLTKRVNNADRKSTRLNSSH